jgi:hypothetical protein
MSRESLSARVQIPSLLPGIDLLCSGEHEYYSFIVVLGIVPDLFHDNGKYRPSSFDYAQLGVEMTTTPWSAVHQSGPGMSLDLKMQRIPPDMHFTSMLSIGIRFGKATSGRETSNRGVEQIPRAGCAKVLALV